MPLHEPQGFPANVPDPLHMLQRPDACSGIAISPCVGAIRQKKVSTSGLQAGLPAFVTLSAANQEYGYQGGDDEYSFRWNYDIFSTVNTHHISSTQNAISPESLLSNGQGILGSRRVAMVASALARSKSDLDQ